MTLGIVAYDYSPPIGGLGIVAKRLRETLCHISPSDRSIVISPSPGADVNSGFLARLWWKRPGGCPLFSLLLACTLSRIVCRHRIDILHVHAGSGGVFLLRHPPCPLVVTAHHTYLQEAEIVFKHQVMKRLWKKLMTRLERRTYVLADRITCVSQDTADFLISRYGIDEKKVSVIENGVDPLPVPSRFPSKASNTILFVGRIEERKGIFVLLSAMALLHRTHAEVQLRLVGSNLLGDRLQETIRAQGLESVVTVVGYLHDPLMARELASSTVLVVPSLLEGFGLIAVQGMLADTCVVASDAPGLRSVVRDGTTGILFHSDDAASLAGALARVLGDSALRSRLESSARAEAGERFSFRRMAVEFLLLLARLSGSS
jgi:colanic acid/amylovoran biosynthesis glycosyltransferase